MAYQQLTLEERSMIYGFCKAGFSNNQIAQELGRHKSTIGRELKRNKGMKGYRPKQANEMAKESFIGNNLMKLKIILYYI